MREGHSYFQKMPKKTYADHIQFINRPLPEKLILLIEKLENPRILDLGCGDGVIIDSLISNNIIKPGQITGVDIDRERLKVASKLNPSVRLITSGGVKLPF